MTLYQSHYICTCRVIGTFHYGIDIVCQRKSVPSVPKKICNLYHTLPCHISSIFSLWKLDEKKGTKSSRSPASPAPPPASWLPLQSPSEFHRRHPAERPCQRWPWPGLLMLFGWRFSHEQTVMIHVIWCNLGVRSFWFFFVRSPPMNK